jgi:hypothetical protein
MVGVSPGGREREVPHELVAMCHLKRSLPSLVTVGAVSGEVNCVELWERRAAIFWW